LPTLQRSPDFTGWLFLYFVRLVEIGGLCSQYDVPHVVNNAYGVQSKAAVALINQCARRGRLDAIIQSTDKNFMVPVGGAIIAGPKKSLLDDINNLYPGRASIGPILDVFVTWLAMGKCGWTRLLDDREVSTP
jgi:O-phospho-L-seryl-tRNASec:L-selenocysteinyl-tRNA synthase